MKKTLLSLSLGLALIAGVSAVQAQDANGAGGFVSATAGSAHWDANGSTANRFAYGVSGGYRWSLDANQSLGAEIGYVNFGKLRASNDFARETLDADAGTLGANYRYTFQDSYYVEGRGGYMRWHAKDKVTVYGLGHASDSTDGNGWYAGAAVGRDFTPNFGVKVGYDFHRANGDNDHVNFGVASVGAEYRF